MHKSLYTRPNKPKFKTVQRRDEQPVRAVIELPKIITVDKSTDCHVTPDDVAARMVEYLAPLGGRATLEPHGGTGSLVQAFLDDREPFKDITVIERNYDLRNVLEKRFENVPSVTIIQSCFLEFVEKVKNKQKYPQILMNPPFKDVKKQMAAALSLLDKNDPHPGILVALVPITYEHEDAETCEVLERGIFANTNVLTKIIRFEY